MKPMKSVNVKKSPFLPATEGYCELLGYQKIYLEEHLTTVMLKKESCVRDTNPMFSSLFLGSRQIFQCFLHNGSLVPADYSGAVFNRAHFQKVAQISSSCNFHYIS